jgi:nucleoside-diphosphate-sugar epimerase
MTIIRFFNVYGPFQRPYFVASKTLYHHLRGEQPLKYDTGKQTRCYTYIGDAVEAVQRVFEAERSNGETYHIGSNFEHTVDDLIAISASVTGTKQAPKPFDTSKEYGKYYEDIERRVPDVSKIREHVGWTAATNLEQGMAKFRDWAMASPWWLALDV